MTACLVYAEGLFCRQKQQRPGGGGAGCVLHPRLLDEGKVGLLLFSNYPALVTQYWWHRHRVTAV